MNRSPYSDAPESHWDTSDFMEPHSDEEAPEQDFYYEMTDSDQARLDDIDDCNNSRMYEEE